MQKGETDNSVITVGDEHSSLKLTDQRIRNGKQRSWQQELWSHGDHKNHKNPHGDHKMHTQRKIHVFEKMSQSLKSQIIQIRNQLYRPIASVITEKIIKDLL